MPANVREAEKAVIGALILKGDLIKTLELDADDFHGPMNRLLFQSMRNMEERGEPIDLTTLITALQESEHVDETLQYLVEAAETVPSTSNLEHYAGRVKQYARERTARSLMAGFLNGDAVLAETIEQLNRLELGEGSKKRQTLSEGIDELYADLQLEKPEISGYPLGFPELDRMLDGLQPGENVIFGARPAMGKSAFVFNVAQYMGAQGVGVSLFNYEMFNKAITRRIVSSAARVENKRLRNGSRMEDEDWKRFSASVGPLATYPIALHEASGMTVRDIRKAAMKDMVEFGRDKHVIIVDYLQLIRYHGNANKPKHERVGEISWELKQIALELGVPIILLSQLSRGVEQRQDKRPMMSDLRDSGEVEQNADIIGFLYRDEYYDPNTEDQNIVELIIAKQREGETGMVKLYFEKQFGKMLSFENELGGR